MTDLMQTARFALPLLATAQAQKEVTHNEALALLDALVHAAIEDGPVATLPTSPVAGQCWIVGSGASGAWAGQGDKLAIWTEGGWRFAPPRSGMRLFRLSDGAWLRFHAGAWALPEAVATPAGGVTIDSEARSAIAALILLLEAQGLLISG